MKKYFALKLDSYDYTNEKLIDLLVNHDKLADSE